jgi:hypothetical protein
MGGAAIRIHYPFPAAEQLRQRFATLSEIVFPDGLICVKDASRGHDPGMNTPAASEPHPACKPCNANAAQIIRAARFGVAQPERFQEYRLTQA